MPRETQKGREKPTAEKREYKKMFDELTDALAAEHHDEYEYRAVHRNNAKHRSLADIVKKPHPVSTLDVAREMAVRTMGDVVALHKDGEDIQQTLKRLTGEGYSKKKVPTPEELDMSEDAHTRLDDLVAYLGSNKPDAVLALLQDLDTQPDSTLEAFGEELTARIDEQAASLAYGLPKRKNTIDNGFPHKIIVSDKFPMNAKQHAAIDALLGNYVMPVLERLLEKYTKLNDVKRFIALFHRFTDVLDTQLITGAPEAMKPAINANFRLEIVGEIMKLWKEEQEKQEGMSAKNELLYKLGRKFHILNAADTKNIEMLKTIYELGSERGPGYDRT